MKMQNVNEPDLRSPGFARFAVEMLAVKVRFAW